MPNLNFAGALKRKFKEKDNGLCYHPCTGG